MTSSSILSSWLTILFILVTTLLFLTKHTSAVEKDTVVPLVIIAVDIGKTKDVADMFATISKHEFHVVAFLGHPKTTSQSILDDLNTLLESKKLKTYYATTRRAILVASEGVDLKEATLGRLLTVNRREIYIDVDATDKAPVSEFALDELANYNCQLRGPNSDPDYIMFRYDQDDAITISSPSYMKKIIQEQPINPQESKDKNFIMKKATVQVPKPEKCLGKCSEYAKDPRYFWPIFGTCVGVAVILLIIIIIQWYRINNRFNSVE